MFSLAQDLDNNIMTVTLLDMPQRPLKLNIPLVTKPEPQWFTLKPTVKSAELLLKQDYGIRYLWATALTSRLQIEEMLLKRNTTSA